MSEVRRDPGEYSREGAAIAEAMQDWLAAEIGSSSMQRNAYLDDLATMQDTFRMPLHDPANLNGSKALSHYGRLKNFMPLFIANYTDDNIAAQELFFVQINLSGLFRKQCYLQATDQFDYIERRIASGNVLGVDVTPIVEDQLAVRAIASLSSAEDLGTATLELNDRLLEVNDRLHTTGASDLKQERSPSVTTLLEQQEAWLRIAVDHILFAAGVRGSSLERVPFWEPKGMSDNDKPHEIYYPFAA